MAYCSCTGKVTNPKPLCDGCIRANKIIVGCGQGLLPCGGTTIINLNTYNNNPAGTVYSLIPGGYAAGDFTAASITSAGVLSVTAGSNYEPHGLHEIKYRVDKGTNTDFESIWLCFDSPCNTGCVKCNTCTGECYGTPTVSEATVACGGADYIYDATTGLNIASCDGTTTWTVTAPTAISPVINSAGLITYDITEFAVPGTTYRITWKGVCSLYGMEVTGYIDVTIPNLCIGADPCAANQECDKCTGLCVDKESDMSASGSAIGSSDSVSVTIT